MTKTIFRSLMLMLTIRLTSVNVLGQNVKDFYIPDLSKYNKVSFYTPNKAGEKSDAREVIYYVDNGDGTFEVLEAKMFKGQATSIVKRTVKFTASEVKLVSTITTTPFETNKKRVYDPPKTLLKMPTAGQTATWITPGEEGDKPTKYTSSWTTATIDGQSKKAIEVIEQYTEPGWGKMIYYYVEGIGLMDTDGIGESGVKRPMRRLDGLFYEESEAEKEQKRKKREIEITSQLYDLKEYDPIRYEEEFISQRNKIINFLLFDIGSSSSQNFTFPSFKDLEKRDLKFERLNNTYTVFYESSPSTSYRTRQDVKLIKGTDHDCSLLKQESIQIPPIVVEGFKVITFAMFENIKVDFTRGLTEVKITDGNVNFQKYAPEHDLQPLIVEKLKDKPSGKYSVKYEIGNILNYDVLKIEESALPVLESKKSNNGKKVLKAIGIAALIGFLLFR